MKGVAFFRSFRLYQQIGTEICVRPLRSKRLFSSYYQRNEVSRVESLLNSAASSLESSSDSDKSEVMKEVFNSLSSHFSSRKLIPEQLLLKVLDASIEQHSLFPNVIQVARPKFSTNNKKGNLIVCGDTHGQYFDFCKIFEDKTAGHPSMTNSFLFNGDIVDRGPMACEILILLLGLKLIHSDSVHILRGNHETTQMNKYYGFEKEVLQKYGKSALIRFRQLFLQLPVAAVIENLSFVVHAGIGPQSYDLSIEDFNKLDRRAEDEFDNPISELLWSDPFEGKGFKINKARGGGYMFGEDATMHFLSKNNLQLLIRSHEVVHNGFEVHHQSRCITVFSAPNYTGSMKNKGAVIKFDGNKEELQGSLIQFSAA